jgi:acyl-CoA dehydrogenase
MARLATCADAVRQGGHYVINGYKRWITAAKDADFLQLVAATDRAKGSRGGLSMFLVDMDPPGVKVTRETKTMMGDLTYEIAFDDARVPAAILRGPRFARAPQDDGVGRGRP